ncbi:unnamed protein product, partial [Bubo scandiacus]
ERREDREKRKGTGSKAVMEKETVATERRGEGRDRGREGEKEQQTSDGKQARGIGKERRQDGGIQKT